MTKEIRKILIIPFFILISNAILSLPLRLQGVVKDTQTKEILVFASLGLEKYPMGTCTNLSGEYQLIVDDSLANEIITVSVIGYESKKFRITDMRGDFFEILLDPKTIQLEEVLVLPTLTGEELLKRVIKHHSKNYPFGFCYHETFFRDIMTDNNVHAKMKNCRLTEAAVNIEDFGLDSSRDPKFLVHEIRNSYNYVKTDKWSKALIWKIKNPLQEVYLWRNEVSRSDLKKILKDECFSRKISEIKMIGNTPIYVLDIRQESHKFLGQRYNDLKAYKTKRLYVNAKNWAIIEAQHRYIYKKAPNDSVIFQKVIIKMQEFNNKYYLKLIDYEGPITDEYYKIGDDVNYNHKAELLVNNVFFDRKSIDRIRRRNSMKTDQPLWNSEQKYNPEFWNNYNILLDQPLEKAVINDLERNVPLENQFNDRGSKN